MLHDLFLATDHVPPPNGPGAQLRGPPQAPAGAVVFQRLRAYHARDGSLGPVSCNALLGGADSQSKCNSGRDPAAIARHLGRHRSTISRELSRNRSRWDGSYRPSKAQEQANGRRCRSRRNQRFGPREWKLVRGVLGEKWSPEQVSGSLRKRGELSISHETIYRYVWRDRAEGGEVYRHLRCAGKSALGFLLDRTHSRP